MLVVNKYTFSQGHVHVLGILRGARNREHASPNLHAESTGNPRRDLEIQRLMTHQRMQDCEEQLPVSLCFHHALSVKYFYYNQIL